MEESIVDHGSQFRVVDASEAGNANLEPIPGKSYASLSALPTENPFLPGLGIWAMFHIIRRHGKNGEWMRWTPSPVGYNAIFSLWARHPAPDGDSVQMALAPVSVESRRERTTLLSLNETEKLKQWQEIA